MSSTLTQAKEILLAPAAIDSAALDVLVGTVLGPQIDYADLYFQHSRREAWSLEQGQVKSGSYSTEQGVGVRAISGEKTGFAYSDEIVLPALTEAATAARSIAKTGGTTQAIAWRGESVPALYSAADPITAMSASDKIAILQRIDQTARQQDPRVKEVMASLVAAHDVILIVDSEGHLQADIRPMVRLHVTVIVEQDGRRERGNAGGGGRFNLDRYDHQRLDGYATEAVRQALVNLEAIGSPAGAMTVVLGPGWPGILLHEAIGHGLEGDFNRKGTSAFSGRIGQQVAAKGCTVVDDGTLKDRRGSLTVDDEGVPGQSTVLIEDGILKAYMQDKHNARLMGTASTGNGRRESYAHLPMPRMTNTYMLAGSYDPAEILASVDRGLYAVNFSGGQVDITSGKFVFSASEAYLIEKGKVTRPVRGATLIGNGPDVLTRVSMIGNNLELDPGIGVCGKDGQSVPVGVGQPTLKIDELTVGGVEV